MEIWKPINNYDDYFVSNYGRIKSLKGKNERILKITHNNFGYAQVCLSKNNKSKTFRLNRLVAEHFISNPDNLPQVNHIDGNKDNNNVNNLEWCTASYNTKHAFDNNLCIKGEKHHLSKLTIDEVKFIKSSDLSQRKLAKMFGVCKTTISNIKSGLAWSYV